MTATADESATENPGLRVKEVLAGGIGEEIGVLPGDLLKSLNGQPLRDPIDYRFHVSDEEILAIFQRDNEIWEAEISKETDEDLGLVFEEMPILKCDNACVFCFLHQMPRGMRKALYYQDDDYRLSFMHGAYVTLTNLSEDEFRRILDQRLSPMYISVHATDPDLRGRLLGRRGPEDVMPRIRRLASGGIQMHCQVVLCPGLNDGDHLKRTVFDLARWHPRVESVGIVPLGMTRYRRNLPRLTALTPALASGVLELVDGWRETLKRGLGTSFVFASDEFYLMTGQPVPDTGYYETYPLVENGVGMVRRFEDAFHARLGELSRSAKSPRLTVVTGALGGGFMPDLLARMERAAGLRSDLVVVRNRFFGEGITVSGLLTGADIRDALLAAPRGDAILLPPNCLSHHGLFLDDGRPDDLQRELGVPIRVGSYDLVESVRKILEGVEDPIGSDPPVTSHPYLLPVLHA